MIEQSEYILRRENLLKKMDDGSLLILFAGQGRKKSGDENYPFQPNRNFYYLTGIKQENSALMLVKADGESGAFLFIDYKDPNIEKWTGIKLSDDEARKISGIDNIIARSALEAKVDVALKDMTFFGDIKKIYLDLEKELKIDECKSTNELKLELENKYPEISVEDINDTIFHFV